MNDESLEKSVREEIDEIRIEINVLRAIVQSLMHIIADPSINNEDLDTDEE